jgi:hypothetical protein
MAAADEVSMSVKLDTMLCASCTVSFALPADMHRRRKEDGKPFYCPSGHQNTYNGTIQKKLDEVNAKNTELEKKLKESHMDITKDHLPEEHVNIKAVRLAAILQIIDKEADGIDGLTPEYISLRLNLDASQTIEDCNTLHEQGLLTFSDVKGYTPGVPRPWHNMTLPIRDRALSFLEAHADTAHTTRQIAEAINALPSSASATLSLLARAANPDIVRVDPGWFQAA